MGWISDQEPTLEHKGTFFLHNLWVGGKVKNVIFYYIIFWVGGNSCLIKYFFKKKKKKKKKIYVMPRQNFLKV